MSRWIFLILLCISTTAFSQDDIIAREYFKNSEFEKALLEYKRLYQQSPNNLNYILQLVKTQRQLEQYDDAEAVLKDVLTRIKFPGFYVELGYNFQLKEDEAQANENFQKALASLDENSSHVYTVAGRFEEYALLDLAITAYEKAKALNPTLNFELQLARIYGDQGDVEKMFDSYLNFVEKNPNQLSSIKRAMSEFISEDTANPNNILLRKLLLKKIQVNPELLYNEMLSWLFVQQRDFKKAFAQEKAIFNRQPESLDRLKELAQMCYDAHDIETAREVYAFLINTAQDIDTILDAHFKLLNIDTEIADSNQFTDIQNRYLKLFDEYGKFQQTLDLQIAYGHFLAFYLHTPQEGSAFLKESLNLPLSLFQEAKVKMELADILVLQEKFNEALIYYTQIQRNLKNSTISQEARYKVAKTSYFKGDFDWAESQLKILKASTSQLIANDALDLKLMISDNKYEDSTHTALKLYAKADLLGFQNKPDEAIAILDNILQHHKGESIEDQALYKQAQLFEQKKQFDRAEANYKAIILNYKDEILADDAYFALGELYAKHLGQPEQAKQFYEQIIFNHADSIYFVEAQKKFRLLRGDDIN